MIYQNHRLQLMEQDQDTCISSSTPTCFSIKELEAVAVLYLNRILY